MSLLRLRSICKSTKNKIVLHSIQNFPTAMDDIQNNYRASDSMLLNLPMVTIILSNSGRCELRTLHLLFQLIVFKTAVNLLSLWEECCCHCCCYMLEHQILVYVGYCAPSCQYWETERKCTPSATTTNDSTKPNDAYHSRFIDIIFQLGSFTHFEGWTML